MRWRPLTATERRLAFVWGGLVLAVVALRPLWPLAVTVLPRCHFRVLTGQPCPTCGTTRGVLALLDGRLFDALAFNPLLISAAAAFLIGGLVAPLWAWRPGVLPEWNGALPRWLKWSIVVALLVNWAWVIAVD